MKDFVFAAAIFFARRDVVPQLRRTSPPSRGGTAETLTTERLAEQAQELVQQPRELVEQRRGVQDPRDRTQQVAEEVARPGLARDVEHDLVQIDYETEQVDVQRPEH